MKEISAKIYRLFLSSSLAKSTSFLTLAQVISGATNFFLLSIFTKYLLPEDFGKISLIWVFVTVVTIILDSGMNTAFSIKFYKTTLKQQTDNLISIFIYYLITICFLFFLIQIIPNFFLSVIRVNVSTQNLNIVFVLILLILFSNFYTNILIIEKKAKRYFIVKLIFNVLLIVSSLIYLFVLEPNYISYIKVYCIAHFVICCLGIYYMVNNYKILSNIKFSFFKLKVLLRLGLPLVPNSLLLMVLTWGDRYILDTYSGLAAVGIYTVGYRFSEVINQFVIQPFGKAISPMLFEKYANSKDEYKAVLEKVFKYYWIITFSIIIAYFVILKEVFALVIDLRYMEGYNIILIVLLGIVMWGITNFIGATIVMKEKTEKIFIFSLCSVVINIVLNFLLIPKFGIYGAATATFVSYSIQFLMIFWYTQKLFRMNYAFKYVFNSTIISILFLCIIVYISNLSLHVSILISLKTVLALIYFFVIYKYYGIKSMINEIKF